VTKINGVKHPDPDLFTIRGDDIPGLDASSFYETATVEGIVPMLHPHSPWVVEVSDDFQGGVYPLDFQLFASGIHCNIWVGLSNVDFEGYTDEHVANGPGLEDDEFYFAYPWSWEGGAFWGASRLQPGYRDYVEGSQLLDLVTEFDTNIWQTCKDYFGDYSYRPGPFGDGKIQILIFNIRDGLFWDPLNAPYFIEGYFWDYISNLYNANIIHIDTYQWFRRQGENPSGSAPNVDPPYPPELCYPFEYEGTFAHEYQHLINNDVNPSQLLWVNEGCSGLSQVVCDYGFPTGHISSYLDDWWETSLVTWQGSLANYGATFLFTYYMWEHYGGRDFIYALTHAPEVGIAGYNYVLEDLGYSKDFDSVFQDWAIANYLDDTTVSGGRYGYAQLAIPSGDTEGFSIQSSMAYYQKAYRKLFNWNPQLEGNTQVGYPYPYGTTLPYTVNYVQFLQLGDHALVAAFDGPITAGVRAYDGTFEWYSDGTPWSWFRLGQIFTIPDGEPTLKFWSNYGIEQDWDYGYVEVHDVEADQWYTLPGTKTISTIPNQQDNPNTPAQYEPTTYLEAGRWNAFTGSSGGWYQEQMSLTQFAGKEIELYFTYWTDGASEEIGWYIDDIEITGFDTFGMETGTDGWTLNAGWSRTTGVYDLYFSVNFIQNKVVTSLNLNSENNGGPILFPMINNGKVKSGKITMVISAQPGFELPIDTTYLFFYQKIPWFIQ
jgi:Immune inhibitor A-like, MAM domain